MPKPRQSPAQKHIIEDVMHEFKEGDLKSGSGQKVRNRKQAVAIALSEAGVSKNDTQSKTATILTTHFIKRREKADFTKKTDRGDKT